MGLIVQSTDDDYAELIQAVRDKLGIDANDLPDSVIDSILYLEDAEDYFICALGEDFYKNADEIAKRRIKRYLVLKTAINVREDYPDIVRESEFGESVQYAENDNADLLLQNALFEIANKISPELEAASSFVGKFEVIKLGSDY